MIRLYVNEDFSEGAELELPADEVRYFKTVRRGRGPVCLFNERGQIANGVIEGNAFRISKVEKCLLPYYDLTVAVACPDFGTLPAIIRGLSELGVAELLLFSGQRSQVAQSKLKILPRWEKISIESARQCGRGKPLKMSVENWAESPQLERSSARFFLDEAQENASVNVKTESQNGPAFVLIGPEGGWTEEERELARKKSFSFVHFKTPILKVETATLCGAFFSLQNLIPCQNKV